MGGDEDEGLVVVGVFRKKTQAQKKVDGDGADGEVGDANDADSDDDDSDDDDSDDGDDESDDDHSKITGGALTVAVFLQCST